METLESIEQAQKLWWQFTQTYKPFEQLTINDFEAKGLTLTEIKTHIQHYGQLLVNAHSDATDKDTILSAKATGCFHCLHLFNGQEGVDKQSLNHSDLLCNQCGIDGLVSLDHVPEDTDIREAFVEDMEDIWFESTRHSPGKPERQYSVAEIKRYDANT